MAFATAESHNPSVCLPSSGKQLTQSVDNRCPIQIGSVVFPFRRYEFQENAHTVQVFHCLWEEHAPGEYFEQDAKESQLALRLSAIRAGRRNRGQRSMEFLLRGIE